MDTFKAKGSNRGLYHAVRTASFSASLIVAACGGSGGSPVDGDPSAPSPIPPGSGPGNPPPATGPLLLVVGEPGDLNSSERELVNHLEDLGYDVTIADDDGISRPDEAPCPVVVMSKTVKADKMGDKLKPSRCGIVFWEDDQQQLRMLATIDNDGSRGTTWHTPGERVFIRPNAPFELTTGLTGEVDFYDRRDEITYGPIEDLPPDAVIIAELVGFRKDHRAIYLYERGTRLADGTAAAGRRVFFGLYTNTFRHLSPSGMRLFDAAVSWASR